MQFRKAIRENSLAKVIAKNYTSGIATIFMLHRVEQLVHPRITPNEDLKISPEYLVQTIRTLRQKGYAFVSLDELHEILAHKRPARQLVVFTLDDGYRDNLTQALPAFESESVPFTVYVTNGFPNRTADLWWFELEALIQNKECARFDNGEQFAFRTAQEKWDAFFAIRRLFLEGKIQRSDIQAHAGTLNLQNLCMSWEEIKQLNQHPLATIGAHTMSHPALRTLSESEALHEMQASKEELETKLDQRIDHFAYPFGEKQQAGPREFALAQQLGFKTAVTTRAGNIFPEHHHFLTALPRIYLYENEYRLDQLMYTNVLWANKFKRIVTV